MIRAVDTRVAVDTRPTEHPVALIHRNGVVVVDGRWVARGDVAALTQHRHAHDEHAIVRRAVRVVARRTVLFHWRVFPQHRATHLGMAAHATLRHGAAHFERLHVADRTVRVVARGARHLSFAHRHVCDSALGLGDLQPMTCRADFRLCRLHELVRRGFRAVDAMAGGA